MTTNLHTEADPMNRYHLTDCQCGMCSAIREATKDSHEAITSPIRTYADLTEQELEDERRWDHPRYNSPGLPG